MGDSENGRKSVLRGWVCSKECAKKQLYYTQLCYKEYATSICATNGCAMRHLTSEPY